MDKITKFLLKLLKKERFMIIELLQKILILDIDNLDIKKLQGENNLYRIRKGKIKIIFKKQNNKGSIIDINYRDSIYK